MAKVPDDNPYLIGLPSVGKDEYKFVKCCTLVRKLAATCGVGEPDKIRATYLRKHAAKDAIAQGLSDNKISRLADFMGHMDQIHKEHYRQHVAARDILEISQFLEKALRTLDSLENDSGSDSDKDKEFDSTLNNTEINELRNSTLNFDEGKVHI